MARADIMAGRAYVSLYTKNNLLDRGLQNARANLNKFGSDVVSIGAKMTAAGSAMLAPIAASVSLASDFEESFSKFSVVFGESTKRVKEWSDAFATAVGRSKLQVVQFMASTQDLFIPIGFEPGAAEELSKQITTLSVDLASFNNMQDADTLRDLHAALTGSGEVMKKYGVLVSEAAVKQELLNQGMDPKNATEMQKVQARLNIIMAGTTAAQGDALRTAGSFANQLKALKSEFTNLAVEVGSAVLPALSKLSQTMSGVVRGLVSAAKANPEAVVSFVALSTAVAGVGIALIGVGVAAKVAAIGLGAVMAAVAAIRVAVGIAVATMSALSTAVVVGASIIEAAWWAMSTASTLASGIASIAMAGWTAAGGAMAAGWTAVSGVIAAGWAVIMGPVTPFVIAAGVIVAAVSAIAAAAAFATVKGMDFSAAWTLAKDTLGDLFDIAKRVGGVLMDALGGGDFDIAFRAAMAGIKLVLAATIESLKKGWELFWSGALETTKMFFMNFGSIAMKVVSAVSNALSNPVTGAMQLKSALDQLSDKNFDITLGIDTEGMRTEANAELDKLEKELANRKAKRDAETAAKAKQDEAAGGGEPGGAGGGSAQGGANIDEIDGAEKLATAFDRETEALQQQIIALRQGEAAAERFRLAKEGLTETEIDQVMALKAQEEQLKKDQEAAGRLVDRIRDFADADYEKNKQQEGASEEVAKREKDAIQRNLAAGKIDAQTAKEAMAQADIRKAERDHQEKLAAFRGDATVGGQQVGLKQGGASAATFSAQSLLSMGSGAGQGPQVKALIEAKKAIMDQTKLQKEQSDAQIAATKNSKMKHP